METGLAHPCALPFLGDNPKTGHRNKIVLCDTTAELDIKTLVWTRGESMPLELKQRMRCPKCGGVEHITVWFDIPISPSKRVHANEKAAN
jgi:hypothetical protein